MTLINFLTAFTIVFALVGLLLVAGVTWLILTQRDKLYRARYEDFLEQQQRIRSKVREQKGE